MRIVSLALAVILPLAASAQGVAPLPPPPPPPPPPAAKPAPAKAVPADPAKDLRANLRQKKTELIQKNLALTAEQAAAFWPIYKRYDDEVAKWQEQNAALVTEYLAVYDKLDDDTARNLQERLFQQQEKAIQLRRAVAVEAGKVLPARLTAKFIQLDRYYTLLGEVQVQSRIPQIP
jgi:Spy/CpxP family protein refolding chaperone